MASHRFVHPIPTKHSDWPVRAVSGWYSFISNPCEKFQVQFLDFLWASVCARDVPALYLAMVYSWQSVAPLGGKGATRSSSKAIFFSDPVRSQSGKVVR